MILVCIKFTFFLIGPKRLLWSPHIRASGQTGKLHPHKLDRTRRERVLHHLPGLISPHRSLVWVMWVDGALRVKGRGGGYIPPPHIGLNLISPTEYQLCQIYIICVVSWGSCWIFQTWLDLELFVVIIVSTYIVCTQMGFFIFFHL